MAAWRASSLSPGSVRDCLKGGGPEQQRKQQTCVCAHRLITTSKFSSVHLVWLHLLCADSLPKGVLWGLEGQGRGRDGRQMP